MAKNNIRRSTSLNRAEGTTPTPTSDSKKEVKTTNYTLWIIAAITLVVAVYFYLKKRK